MITLFQHQQKALDQTEGHNRCAYYLDMGLGKTFVGSEKMMKLNTRINLVVCQCSKVQDWIEHFQTYYTRNCVFDLTKPKTFKWFFEQVQCEVPTLMIGVINYELTFRRKILKTLTGFTLMLDESSLIQNENAKRSNFILGLHPDNVILLSGAIRYYTQEVWNGYQKEKVEKVEIFKADGIYRYIYQNDMLIADVEAGEHENYFMVEEEGQEPKGFNWTRIPLVPFKYNKQEIPLIRRVKTLQDGINTMISDFENNMQEDARNTILVLKNYDGENLGEFRHNLSTYGAVKVREDGGVETLQVEINAENYKGILELLKKSLIENARGYDAKDDRLSGNPNQMNIQSMYSDIDLDANGMETEFQAAFEELLWFINQDFSNRGLGDYEGAELQIVFNRDILINETESIENCAKSVGILSTETIVEQHPWVTDVEVELARLRKEKDEAMEQAQEYAGAFQTGNQNKGDNGEGE